MRLSREKLEVDFYKFLLTTINTVHEKEEREKKRLSKHRVEIDGMVYINCVCDFVCVRECVV